MTERVREPASKVAKQLKKSVSTIKRWCSKEGAPHDRRRESDDAYMVNAEELLMWRAARCQRMRAAKRAAGAEAAEVVTDQSGTTPAPAREARQPEKTMGVAKPKPGGPRASDVPTPPRRRRRRPRFAEGEAAQEEGYASNSSSPPNERDQDAVLLEWRRAVELNRILRAARSVCVIRIPAEDGDEALWGAEGLQPYVAFSRDEIRRAIDNGGFRVLVQDRLGAGRYRVEVIGVGGHPFPALEIEVPNLKRVFQKLKAEGEDRQRCAAEERKKRRKRQKEAREAARRAAQRRRAEQQRERAVLAWARDVAAVVALETTQRLRWQESVLLAQINAIAHRHGAEQAKLGKQAREVATDLRRWQRDRDRLLRQRARLLRREGKHPDAVQLDAAYEAAQEEPLRVPRRPRDALEPWTTSPLTADLARVRAFDVSALYERALEYLELRADEAFGVPPWVQQLQLELEHLLPTPPPGFVPWLSFRPPPPLAWHPAPRPGPHAAWAPAPSHPVSA